MKRFFIVLITLFAIASCGSNKNVANYEDTQNRQYNQYYEQYGLKDLKEFYNQDEKTYGIYMYGVWCHYCDLCKGAVFDYLDDLSEQKNKKLDNLYIFDRDKDPNFKEYFKQLPKGFEYNRDCDVYVKKMIGASSLTETYFFGTPTLYVIKNGKLSNVLVDYKNCGKYLTTH